MRWLCDLVGYGKGSFGLCTSGGVMANFIAMALVRDVHLRRHPRRIAAAARGGPRERARLHGRPDPLLHRPRARRAGLPAGDPGRPAGRRPVPTARGARRRGHRPRSRRRPDAGRDLRGRRVHEHGLGGPRRGAGHAGGARGTLAPRGCGVRGRRPAVGARRRTRPGPRARRQRHRRSPQVVLPGLRPRARWWCGTATTCARPSTARPSTTAAARPRRPARPHAARTRDGEPRRPAQLLQAGLRGDPPLPRAQAVGQLEAPRHHGPRAGSWS